MPALQLMLLPNLPSAKWHAVCHFVSFTRCAVGLYFHSCQHQSLSDERGGELLQSGVNQVQGLLTRQPSLHPPCQSPHPFWQSATASATQGVCINGCINDTFCSNCSRRGQCRPSHTWGSLNALPPLTASSVGTAALSVSTLIDTGSDIQRSYCLQACEWIALLELQLLTGTCIQKPLPQGQAKQTQHPP